jgi:hypothetical protein
MFRLFLATGVVFFSLLGNITSINLFKSTLDTNKSVYIPGTDITEQLRDDFSAGRDVTLPPGHFYVSETIIIQGYAGTFKGAGQDVTVIEASQGFKALPDPFFPDIFQLSEMFAFYWSSGDITIKNLTILVTGDAPADPHNNPFFGYRTTIDNAIVIGGVSPELETGIDVEIMNITINGEDSTDPGSHFGYNLMLPLVVTGLGGTGSVSVKIFNCIIANSGHYAIEYFLPNGGSAIIKNNSIDQHWIGIWLGWGLHASTVTVKNNTFTNIIAVPIRIDSPIDSSCIKNNTLDGEIIPAICPK